MNRRLSWGVLLTALLAAGVSIYLVVASRSATGRPLGCGIGSSCDEVLSSPWGRVLGLPVGVPAAALYLLLAAAVGRRGDPTRRSPIRSALLWVIAGAGLSAVCWFVMLQAIEIKAFCPWCLAAHGLGLIAILGALLLEVLERRFRPGLFVIGMSLAGLLAVTQILRPAASPAPTALNSSELAGLETLVERSRDTAPRLGQSTIGQPIALLFDYCCPHCRQTHQLLEQIQQQHPNQLQLLLLPMPLNADCNPHIEETEPRFKSSCELARLALAIWRQHPNRFAEFDQWLFATEQPRTAETAREQVLQWMSADELDAALADPWVEAHLQTNVRAFQSSGVESLPVLVAPGAGGVSGRVQSMTALVELLQLDLDLSP
ncbi:MAG: vitamin K epoxide reductase family protein [Planctomycetaceae bacterium]